MVGAGVQLAEGVRAAKLLARCGVAVVGSPGIMDGGPSERGQHAHRLHGLGAAPGVHHQQGVPAGAGAVHPAQPSLHPEPGLINPAMSLAAIRSRTATGYAATQTETTGQAAAKPARNTKGAQTRSNAQVPRPPAGSPASAFARSRQESSIPPDNATMPLPEITYGQVRTGRRASSAASQDPRTTRTSSASTPVSTSTPAARSAAAP